MDKSGIQMVQKCGCQMVWFSNGGLKTGQKCLFYGQKCPVFNGLPNHKIRPFENQTKKCPESHMFGLEVFGIQMVTVCQMPALI